ncbi:biotin synthase BioB [Hirschia baltica]|uniref:Biotin synthase n=1 Tax=Hirschia baltica (strain ATCC 49814 / DSM 5838 / IFAM 1418) TaxID=582402 RepID=C6XR48_HIRBI|nr:biotin synthase BioB [Hirschia baltica]ACT60579.1 biotin synthase [Hirschia baltica ATCC 49814]
MTTPDLEPRQNWTKDEIAAIYELPLPDLFLAAQQVRKANWPEGRMQKSQLLSIKTGGCAENCGYCSQSAHFDTGIPASKLMDVEAVVGEARKAKENGADRFCMGAAWRSLKDRDLPKVCSMIEAVKAEGMETCVTLGMLKDGQAEALSQAGLDYYNHNLDTSREYYESVVTTRTYEDRIETLGKARNAGLNLCVGGILGMGEGRHDRIGLLHELAQLTPHPESVPINMLVPVEGTPLGEAATKPLEIVELVRAIATARIIFPKSWVRLSAGREAMSSEGQMLCILAGANSIFVGNKLLTADNPEMSEDDSLLAAMGVEQGTIADKPPACAPTAIPAE